MNELDVLYRALCGYKKQTEESRECGLVRKSVVLSNPESDIITVTKAVCTVDEDWIRAIEDGLKHVEKAIDESRQFIRSNGDIVPIEQVKRVSKDSVEHLAKHSDFITKEQDEDNLIPDKLYIVERLSDFAVYENKFLYMMLMYLRSFISFRYDKLSEVSNTYRGSVAISKKMAVNKRKMEFELKLKEEKRDDPLLKQSNPLRYVLERIDLLLKTVVYLLATPLMQEVSRVPVLKPPITKTNVLKMNRNFKGAVALYDFVTAYDKPGFTVENREERINPFSEETAGEFAEIVMLTSFLTYKHGMGIKKVLEKAYEDEEDIRRAQLAREQSEQLLKLKRRLGEEDSDPAEYILLLEKQIKTLETDGKRLLETKQEIDRLLKSEDALKENLRLIAVTLEEKQAEIDVIDDKYLEKMNVLKQQCDKEIAGVKQNCLSEKEELNLRCTDKIEKIKSEYGQEAERKNGIMLKMQEKATAAEEKYLEKARKYDELKDLKAVADSRLLALRREHGLIAAGEDYTAEASFKELEHQLEVFIEFFKDEWKKTKKRIRKEVLKLRPEMEKIKSNGNNQSDNGNT